jgi:hypothetical protein
MHKRKKRISQTHTKSRLRLRNTLRNAEQSTLHIHDRLHITSVSLVRNPAAQAFQTSAQDARHMPQYVQTSVAMLLEAYVSMQTEGFPEVQCAIALYNQLTQAIVL